MPGIRDGVKFVEELSINWGSALGLIISLYPFIHFLLDIPYTSPTHLYFSLILGFTNKVNLNLLFL
jgi:hypothetical protein